MVTHLTHIEIIEVIILRYYSQLRVKYCTYCCLLLLIGGGYASGRWNCGVKILLCSWQVLSWLGTWNINILSRRKREFMTYFFHLQ